MKNDYLWIYGADASFDAGMRSKVPYYLPYNLPYESSRQSHHNPIMMQTPGWPRSDGYHLQTQQGALEVMPKEHRVYVASHAHFTSGFVKGDLAYFPNSTSII